MARYLLIGLGLLAAKMCEEKSVDIFCISTELGAMIKEKPIFWTDLISSVKSIYKGKITYAANWDNYDEVPFWKELDFIGVDAYFPVSESKTPTAAEVNEGWQTQITDLRLCSEKWKKNVLFCEYGFRSVDYAAKEPWNAGSETKGVNLQAQSNSYEGTYNSVWKEDFMAGGFLWRITDLLHRINLPRRL